MLAQKAATSPAIMHSQAARSLRSRIVRSTSTTMTRAQTLMFSQPSMAGDHPSGPIPGTSVIM